MDIKPFDVVKGWFPFRYGPDAEGKTGKPRIGLVVAVRGGLVYVAPAHSDKHYWGHEWSITLLPGTEASAHKPCALVLDRAFAFKCDDLKRIGRLPFEGKETARALRWFTAHGERVLAEATPGGMLKE